ncbi:chaperone modulator CbpM [Paraburkholderia hospita]|uniref:chaperone modulator CbpM n=1 Tax=Paraburkholderia hospita TaxID=169430 RepID=UPI001F60D4B2|nr:chaperone modulator CbpM [Paraburkholderia hospita]
MIGYFEGEIVEEQVEFTLVELCRASGASEEQLMMWISEGAFEPSGPGPEEWRFSGAALNRALSAQRLARDFDINASGIALALDLLDEIEALRAQLKRSNRR